MLYNIQKEYDYDGVWYAVYVDGQQISGFRDQGDANLFGKWYTDSSEGYKNARKYGACGFNNVIRPPCMGGENGG